MFQVNKNDIFAKPMTGQELYATTKMGRAMKMTPFLIKLQQEKELDNFINKLVSNNGVTYY